MLTKFIGKFKHNYADLIEAFTDNRQNDVDLKDISLTWHMKGIFFFQKFCDIFYFSTKSLFSDKLDLVLKEFEFELTEYFNGDDDNMALARKFHLTFNETFSCLKLVTKLYDVCFHDEYTFTAYYKVTDTICDFSKFHF